MCMCQGPQHDHHGFASIASAYYKTKQCAALATDQQVVHVPEQAPPFHSPSRDPTTLGTTDETTATQ